MYSKIRRKVLVFLVVIFIVNLKISSSEELFWDTLRPDFLKNTIIENFKNLSVSKNNSDSDLCVRQFSSISVNISNKDVFPVFDSWGKVPSGILYGHRISIGNYDQCIETSIQLQNLGNFNGQYCLTQVYFDKLLQKAEEQKRHGETEEEVPEKDTSPSITIGICIPSECNPSKTSELLTQFFNGATVNLTNCSTKELPPFRTIDWIAIGVFSFIGVLMLINTIYDYVTRLLHKEQKELLLLFSVFHNLDHVFNFEQRVDVKEISCIYGMKAISMMWIIFGHTYMWNLLAPLDNPIILQESWPKTFFSMFVQQSVFSVDTFFLLSGFLLAWTAFREIERRKGKLNAGLMFFHRIIRTAPLKIVLVFVVVSVFRYFGSGPFWETYSRPLQFYCEENWWKTMLFIQNYAQPEEMCLGHTFYIAIDMQLYFLSPLVIIPLWKWGKKVIPALIILCLLSVVAIIIIFYHEGYDEVIGVQEFENSNILKLTYYATHTRFPVWLIGIIVGYLMYTTKTKPLNIPWYVIISGWAVCLGTMLAIVIGPINVTKEGHNKSDIEATLYDSLSRVSWALVICWVIFACHRGYSSHINKILSNPVWMPIYRLNYCIYLSHYVVQIAIFGNIQTDVHFTNFNAILQFWSCYGLTLCVALLLALSCEGPMVALEHYLFPRHHHHHHHSHHHQEEQKEEPMPNTICNNIC